MAQGIDDLGDLLNIVDELSGESVKLKQLTENLQMGGSPSDKLKMLQGLMGKLGLGEGKLSELKDRLGYLADGYGKLNAEERKQFEENAATFLKDKMQQIKENVEAAEGTVFGEPKRMMVKGIGVHNDEFYGNLTIAVAFVILVIIAFFGYKLYKSLKDKEVKREEKRKMKQMKKKK